MPQGVFCKGEQLTDGTDTGIHMCLIWNMSKDKT